MTKKSEADSGGTELAVRETRFIITRSSLDEVFMMGVACGCLMMTAALNLMLLFFF